jgi:glycerol transport system ATP-binding protein
VKSEAAVRLDNGRTLPIDLFPSGVPEGPCRLAFRADAVGIGPARDGWLSFPGTVSVTELSGSESFVHVDVGMGTWVCLASGIQQWEPGDAVEVQLDLAKAFLFGPQGQRLLLSPVGGA